MNEQLIAQLLRGMLLLLAREMSPKLLDELFSLDSNDPKAHKLLKDHFDGLHRSLKGRKSQSAPAPAGRSNRRRSDGTPDVSMPSTRINSLAAF